MLHSLTLRELIGRVAGDLVQQLLIHEVRRLEHASVGHGNDHVSPCLELLSAQVILAALTARGSGSLAVVLHELDAGFPQVEACLVVIRIRRIAKNLSAADSTAGELEAESEEDLVGAVSGTGAGTDGWRFRFTAAQGDEAHRHEEDQEPGGHGPVRTPEFGKGAIPTTRPPGSFSLMSSPPARLPTARPRIAARRRSTLHAP